MRPACLIAVLLLALPACGGERAVPVYDFRVVRSFTHDPTSFTQGLVFENGLFYEGSGLRGRSSLRRYSPDTKQMTIQPLPDEYFGEGVALHGDKIFQLTWQSNIGFIYDKSSLALLGSFRYPTEGWGLTSDGTRLIMSDGSATLYFIDPERFVPVRQIQVTDAGRAIDNLNELEFIKGEVYANVWGSDRIARIDPATGRVNAWIDLTRLSKNVKTPRAVLNGIAYDAARNRLFVTGKLWPAIYEIELVRR